MPITERNEAISLIDRGLVATLGGQIEFDEGIDLIEAGFLDSLDFVRFIFNLEKISGAKLPIVDLAESGLSCVGNLVDFIIKKSI